MKHKRLVISVVIGVLICLGLIASRPARSVGSFSICTGAFFVVVGIVLVMCVFAFACRDKTASGRWPIAFFPPVLAFADVVFGAKWSLLFFVRRWRINVRWLGRSTTCGADQIMVSILCASFGVFFAVEALRGPSRWQRLCGVLFAIHSVAVLVYMTIEIKGWL